VTTDHRYRNVEEILETHCAAWPHGVPLPAGATPHAARVVLNVQGYGYPGYPSDFDRALCRVVFAGDRAHRGRLCAVYPEMVDAVELHERSGVAATRALAGSDAGGHPT